MIVFKGAERNDTMAQELKSKKSKNQVIELDDDKDMGFAMALLDDPVGRKVVLFMGFAIYFFLGCILSTKNMIILNSIFLFSVLGAAVFLTYELKIDVLALCKRLGGGTPDVKKNK